MALNIVAQPNQYHPGYNPVVFGANDSTDYRLPGYRYVFSFYESGESTPFQILKAAPNPVNGDGIVDVSKALQSFISYDLDFNTLVPFEANNSFFIYDVKIGYEHIIAWNFTSFTNGSGIYSSSVKLVSTINSPYSIGDYITITIDPSITDSRKILNNTFRILEVGTNYVVISLAYSALGGEPSINGVTFVNTGELISDYDVETISDRIVYNEAVPFKDFPGWNEGDILPQDVGLGNEYLLTGNILTNSPNAIDEYYLTSTINDKDKYIIKPYQELYWNVMNNPIGDDSTTLANSMIAKNEFGDLWLLSDYTNWDDASIKMIQFNVSPDNLDWVSITPNYDNSTGQPFMFNPYTHINSDGSISQAKWIDIYPTFAPGNDTCDEITGLIELTPASGPATSTTFIARPIGTGANQRRIYITTINDKQALLWQGVGSGPSFIRYWYISFIDEVITNPGSSNIIIPSVYNGFSTKTSNTLPFGTTFASNNTGDAWKAFDGDSNTYWETTGALSSASITYIFNSGARLWSSVFSYSINKGTSITNAPKNWTVEGSVDSTTWTTLHTVTDSNTTGIYQSPTIWDGNQYRYIRLSVSGVIAGTEVRVNEFKIVSTSFYAQLTSASDCPVGGTGFLIWNFTGSAPGITSKNIVTTATGVDTYPTLKPRRIYLDYTCQDNQTQILFLDRAGSWSSFAFPLKVNERMDNEKLDYRTNIGFVEGGQWTYNTYDAEVKTYHSNVKKQYNLTTNFLNEGMDTYFQELISSPVTYVKLKDSTVWLSCNVLTKSLEPITRRLKQRTITIELNSQDNINI